MGTDRGIATKHDERIPAVNIGMKTYISVLVSVRFLCGTCFSRRCVAQNTEQRSRQLVEKHGLQKLDRSYNARQKKHIYVCFYMFGLFLLLVPQT